MLIASQAVGAVPRGIKWVDVPQLMVPQLAAVLPGLPEGLHTVTVTGTRWSLDLNVSKRRTAPGDSGRFFTARVYPGDAAAGTIEAQFDQLPDEPRIRALLGSIDQIWGINSAVLESEDVIFTNQIFPPMYDNANYCSLELGSDKFWQVSR